MKKLAVMVAASMVAPSLGALNVNAEVVNSQVDISESGEVKGSFSEDDNKVTVVGNGTLNKEKFHNFLNSIQGEVKIIEIKDPLTLPINCSKLFSVDSVKKDIQNAEIILNSDINTSKVENMEYMFKGLKKANPDVSKWDVSKVIYMRGMFTTTETANPDVSNWNLNSVKDFSSMFSGANSANPDVSKWKFPNCKKLFNVFAGTDSANPDVSKWDVSKVENFEGLFSYAKKAQPEVGNWDVSNATKMTAMFQGIRAKKLDVSNWDVGRVKSFQSMFAKTMVEELDLSKWNMKDAQYISDMFANLYPNIDGQPPTNLGHVRLPDFRATNTGIVTFYKSYKGFNLTAPKAVFEKYGNKMYSGRKEMYAFFDENDKIISNSTFFLSKFPDVQDSKVKSFLTALEDDKSYTVKKVKYSYKNNLVYTVGQNITNADYLDIVKDMPDGITWKVRGQIDTSSAGKKRFFFEPTFPLGGAARLTIDYTVKEAPKPTIPETDIKKIVLNKDDVVPEGIYKDHIANLPEGTKVETIYGGIRTNTAHEGEVSVRVIYPDGYIIETKIPFIVKEKDTTLPIEETDIRKIILNKGDEVPGRIYGEHIDYLPTGTIVRPTGEGITTEEAKTGEVEVKVIYSNGTEKIVNIPYEVREVIPIIPIKPIRPIECCEIMKITLYTGDEVPDAIYGEHILNLPDNTEVVPTDEGIITDVPKTGKVNVMVTYEDGSGLKVDIPYEVLEKEKPALPNTEKITLYKGDDVPEDIYFKHVIGLPEGAKVNPLERITTEKVKEGKVKVEVIYADGSKVEVEIPYIVKKKPNGGGGGGGSHSGGGGGGGGYTPTTPTAPDGVNTIIGEDRHETSLEASKHVNSDVLVVANGESFADALSAQNIVNKYNAKFVLIYNNSDIDRVIRITKPKKVFIVGGKSTIYPSTFYKFRDRVKESYRVGGIDRYRTNKHTLRIGNFEQHAVADGRNFPDALSSAPLNRKDRLGLVLVDGSKRNKVEREVVYTYGGENSVKKTRGKRLAGKDRYITNLAINRELENVRNAVIVNGEEFPDALAAQNLLSKNDTCIVLGNKLTKSQIEELKKKDKVFILGGSLGLDASIFK